MKARAKEIKNNRMNAKVRRDGTGIGDGTGGPMVDAVSSRSRGKTPARAAVTVTGNGTAGGRYATETGIRVPVVEMTECVEMRLLKDVQPDRLTMVRSSGTSTRGQGLEEQ